jgi:hypothetical protein
MTTKSPENHRCASSADTDINATGGLPALALRPAELAALVRSARSDDPDPSAGPTSTSSSSSSDATTLPGGSGTAQQRQRQQQEGPPSQRAAKVQTFLAVLREAIDLINEDVDEDWL